jgi:hypothetical protein
LVALLGWLAAPTAQAGDSALGAYALNASSHGLQILLGGQIDAGVPHAESTYDTGEVGHGLAAVVWPGSLLANAGDLIPVVAGSQIPPEVATNAHVLNDPVRAEARSPAGPAEADYGAVPGVDMRAAANANGATAHASLRRLDSPGVASAGGIAASTSTTIGGATATSKATSTVTDVSVAGVLKIGSIVSTATASSNGTAGAGSGTTTISGVTVAGQPAMIDQGGLHLGAGTNVPVDASANQLAEQALAQAQIKVILTPGVHEIRGRSATQGAQSLLIEAGGGQLGIIIGGASAHASASLPFDVALAPGSTTAAPAADAAPTGSSGGGVVSVPSNPTLAPAGPAATPAEPAAVPAVSRNLAAFLGRANPFWLVLLGAFVGWFIAAFLRRLGMGILDIGNDCDIGAAP